MQTHPILSVIIVNWNVCNLVLQSLASIYASWGDAPGLEVIIIDNASFHKGQSIREIVEEAGCPKGYRFAYEIWYLPPYSPNLNPDELVWNHLKNHKIGRTEIWKLAFHTCQDCNIKHLKPGSK